MERVDKDYGPGGQSDVYVRVRELEDRMLSDEIVKNLPIVSKSNPYHQEWRWRRRSFARLQAHLLRRFQGSPVRVLDLGCGNGWMSHHLAKAPRFEVLGVDVNMPELAQATRLFSRGNLRFSHTDVLSGALGEQKFDIIIVAAAVQYFPDLERLLQILRGHLLSNGEIHLTDTRFYPNEKEQLAAKARSTSYYTQLGVPEMADYYYHHSLPEVLRLGGKDMNKHLITKFLKKIKWFSPLDWFLVG